MEQNKVKIYDEIVTFLKGKNARKIAIFGSFLGEEVSDPNDIDVLVEFSGKNTLFDLAGIEQDLSDKIGIKIDLVTEQSISPYLIDRVREEMKVIYQ